ncbi:MAG: polysaccharide biosynthesis/export family protein [Myxococcota bacterium]
MVRTAGFLRFWLGAWALGGAGCASTCPAIQEAERQAFLAARPEQAGYLINSGDQVQVEVWQNPQLTRTVTVRPDGKITLPLVNDVPAASMTVPQFQERLTAELKTYIKEPVVSITILQFTSKQIFLQGQVRTPAAYTFRGDMHMLQALALAGGPTAFYEGCAVVVRQKGDQFLRYAVDLDPLLKGRDLTDNIALQPNDVVTVQ